jgi:hypothetical protein
MDHFRPINNKLFKSRDFWDVVVSDLGILTVIGTSPSFLLFPSKPIRLCNLIDRCLLSP